MEKVELNIKYFSWKFDNQKGRFDNKNLQKKYVEMKLFFS